MPKQHPWKTIASSALALSLLAGTPVYADEAPIPAAAAAEAGAAQAQGSLKTPFSDVASGHWAEKHIAKLYLQGIVTGYNGAFRPSDNVSQQEAVVMALRFMGVAGQAKQDEAVVFPTAFTVSDFYKSYVNLALTNGLLDRTEEFKAAENAPDEAWGTRKASREWITKLAVRAIGQKAKADALAGQPSSFGDSADISEGFAGYINAAAELNLVKGVSADSFAPQAAVNRASLVTIFSRAESLISVAYAGQSSGVIAALADGIVVLYGADGKETTYRTNASTLYARSDSEKLFPLSGLQAYTDGTVIAKDGVALYVEQSGTEVRTKSVSGTIVSNLPGSQQFYLKLADGSVEKFVYNDSAFFRDASGNVIAADKLLEGSTVDVSMDTFRQTPTVLDVRLVGEIVNKSGKGTLVSAADGKLSIRDEGADESQTWSAASGLTPTYQDRVIALNELRAGDIVVYEVKDNVVTKLTVQSTSGKTITGAFSSIDTANKTITYLLNGVPDAKLLDDNVVYVIEGVLGATSADIVQDDMLELTINASGKVTQVKVLNRKVEPLTGASIVSYAEAKKALTVQDSKGDFHVYTLTDTTKFDLNGAKLSLAAAEPLLKNGAGKRVTIDYTGQTAIAIEFVYQYTGKVTSVNTVSSQITLMLDTGASVTLPFMTPAVDILGNATSSVANIAVGDTVTATMDTIDQTKAVAFLVHRTVQQEIVSVNASTGKIKLKAADGTATEWTAGNDWSITDETGASLQLANLKVGDTANVTFAGKKPVSLMTVGVTDGTLAAVGSDRITVTTYKGETRELTLGSSYRIVKNGAAISALTGLAAGDRVDVRRDETGAVLITVIPGLSKTFWKYDAATNEILVQHALNENYRYAVTADTRVQSGGTAVSAAAFLNGDKLTLYVYNGKLLEVVKG